MFACWVIRKSKNSHIIVSFPNAVGGRKEKNEKYFVSSFFLHSRSWYFVVHSSIHPQSTMNSMKIFGTAQNWIRFTFTNLNSFQISRFIEYMCCVVSKMWNVRRAKESSYDDDDIIQKIYIEQCLFVQIQYLFVWVKQQIYFVILFPKFFLPPTALLVWYFYLLDCRLLPEWMTINKSEPFNSRAVELSYLLRTAQRNQPHPLSHFLLRYRQTTTTTKEWKKYFCWCLCVLDFSPFRWTKNGKLRKDRKNVYGVCKDDVDEEESLEALREGRKTIKKGERKIEHGKSCVGWKMKNKKKKKRWKRISWFLLFCCYPFLCLFCLPWNNKNRKRKTHSHMRNFLIKSLETSQISERKKNKEQKIHRLYVYPQSTHASIKHFNRYKFFRKKKENWISRLSKPHTMRIWFTIWEKVLLTCKVSELVNIIISYSTTNDDVIGRWALRSSRYVN